MRDSKSNNKLIGILGIVFGLICFCSFLAGDNTKLIIPISNLFLVKYFMVISIINGGMYFIIAGLVILSGIFAPSYAKTKIEHKKTKAKGLLFSVFLLSPFLLSFFATIFSMSQNVFWKILGSLALIYITWLVYSNVRILRMRRQ